MTVNRRRRWFGSVQGDLGQRLTDLENRVACGFDRLQLERDQTGRSAKGNTRSRFRFRADRRRAISRRSAGSGFAGHIAEAPNGSRADRRSMAGGGKARRHNGDCRDNCFVITSIRKITRSRRRVE